MDDIYRFSSTNLFDHLRGFSTLLADMIFISHQIRNKKIIPSIYYALSMFKVLIIPY